MGKKAGSFPGEGGAWAKAPGRDKRWGDQGERRLAEVFICRAGGGLRPSSPGQEISQTGVSRAWGMGPSTMAPGDRAQQGCPKRWERVCPHFLQAGSPQANFIWP